MSAAAPEKRKREPKDEFIAPISWPIADSEPCLLVRMATSLAPLAIREDFRFSPVAATVSRIDCIVSKRWAIAVLALISFSVFDSCPRMEIVRLTETPRDRPTSA